MARGVALVSRRLRSLLGVGEGLGDRRTRQPVKEFDELATDEDDAAVELPMRQESPGDAAPHGFLGHAQEPSGARYVEQLAVESAAAGRHTLSLRRRSSRRRLHFVTITSPRMAAWIRAANSGESGNFPRSTWPIRTGCILTRGAMS
jgi:hypothetical protein